MGNHRGGAISVPLIAAQAGLVIIDMPRDFLEPGGFGAALGNDVSLLRRAIAPTQRLLEAARIASLTVIHTREGHRPDLADLPPAKKARGRLPNGIGDPGPMGRILVRGEPGHDIIPELYPAPGEPVVDKPGKGAFHATDFDAMLKNRGITQLIVCGVTTEVCVNTTVREANDRGYECSTSAWLSVPKRVPSDAAPARPRDRAGNPAEHRRLGTDPYRRSARRGRYFSRASWHGQARRHGCRLSRDGSARRRRCARWIDPWRHCRFYYRPKVR